MRGRYLLGLSNANRQAAGVVVGDEVEVESAKKPETRISRIEKALAMLRDHSR